MKGYQCQGRRTGHPRCTNRVPDRLGVCRSCQQDGLEDMDRVDGEPSDWWKDHLIEEAGYEPPRSARKGTPVTDGKQPSDG